MYDCDGSLGTQLIIYNYNDNSDKVSVMQKVFYSVRIALLLVVVHFLVSAILSVSVMAGASPSPWTSDFFESARREVKSQYVGNDTQIDAVFDQIKSWYLNPELRTKPLIVNLWGPTGLGKSSIVEKVVKTLRLNNDFHYFRMEKFAQPKETAGGGLEYELSRAMTQKESIAPYVTVDVIHEPKNPILFFDEVQKVNTLLRGSPVDRPAAQAFWELLGNDGRLTIPNPTYYSLKNLADKPDLYSDIPKEIKYGIDKDLAAKTLSEALDSAKKALGNTAPQHELDLSKSLIFVAGNLDNAFAGSSLYNVEALSANELHKITAAVTVTQIKQELAQNFKPEQVARLGTRNIIFPTLSENDFRQYIDLRLTEIQKLAREKTGLDIEYTPRFRDRIYKEAVIPSQGVRPVRATVDNFALDPLADIAQKIKELPTRSRKGAFHVLADVTPMASQAIWTISGTSGAKIQIKSNVPDEYARSLKPHAPDTQALTSIRQAGKATVAISVDHELPLSIHSRSRSGSQMGWIQSAEDSSQPIQFRSDLVNDVAKKIGGYVAEELVYGEVSTASMADLGTASNLVKSMVQAYGMGKSDRASLLNQGEVQRDAREIQSEADGIMEEARQKAELALRKEQGFFQAMTNELFGRTSANKGKIKKIFQEKWSNQLEVSEVLSNSPKNRSFRCVREDISSFLHGEDFQLKSRTKSPAKIGF